VSLKRPQNAHGESGVAVALSSQGSLLRSPNAAVSSVSGLASILLMSNTHRQSVVVLHPHEGWRIRHEMIDRHIRQRKREREHAVCEEVDTKRATTDA
jgi:hypothetical protein